ncbi:hypothetical protein [Mycobacterium riyadhense]|uniref:hypothetical protein n=1 Tax=Mycobacterium riyadhense TaxID=486698 RepID=UPI00195B1615|nr:hypothetical protein [Mycobacterium riyadhense]
MAGQSLQATGVIGLVLEDSAAAIAFGAEITAGTAARRSTKGDPSSEVTRELTKLGFRQLALIPDAT